MTPISGDLAWRIQMMSDAYWLGRPLIKCGWQSHAHLTIHKLVKEGRMPRSIDSGLACIDCGKPAEVWEHRDYSKPAAVDPCCKSCNSKRGPAFYPSYAPPATRHQQKVALREMRYRTKEFLEAMKVQKSGRSS